MNAVPTDRRRPAWPPENATGALVVGTFLGSSLLTGTIVLVALVTGLAQGGLAEVLGSGALIAILFFLFSLPVWAGGLIMVGIPGWMVLHALGWRSRWAGAAFGAVATFVVSWILNLGLNLGLADNLGPFLILAGILAVIGAVVGWVVVSASHGEREGTR